MAHNVLLFNRTFYCVKVFKMVDLLFWNEIITIYTHSNTLNQK